MVGGVALASFSVFRSHPKYETSAQVLINLPKSEKASDAEQDSAEMGRLLNTSMVLLKNQLLLKDVANELNRKYDYSFSTGSIKRTLDISNDQGSQFISVKATSSNSKKGVRVANSVVKAFDKRAPEILNVGRVVVVKANSPATEISNTRTHIKNTLAGLVLGLFIGLVATFIIELAGNRIRTSNYLSDKYNIRVIGFLDLSTQKKK